MLYFLGFKLGSRDEYRDYYEQDDDERTDPRWRARLVRASQPRLAIHYAALAGVLGLVLAITWLAAGKFVALKLASHLLAPVGLVWMALFVLAYSMMLLRQGLPAMLAWLAWLVLGLAGNSFIANSLAEGLERPYYESDPLAVEPLDAIVVLGGCTKMGPQGEAQVTMSGDRLVLAARMYHAGRCERIVCTGSNWLGLVEGELDIRQQAKAVLVGLEVPEQKIELLSGRSTREEMESVGQWLQQNPEVERVGLVTSAWHMPRAQRTAAKWLDRELTPVPADSFQEPYRPNPNLLVPHCDYLAVSSRCVQEYLGGWIGY